MEDIIVMKARMAVKACGGGAGDGSKNVLPVGAAAAENLVATAGKVSLIAAASADAAAGFSAMAISGW